MALSPADELTLSEILRYWFLYEPKDVKQRRALLNYLKDALTDGRLKYSGERSQSLFIPDSSPFEWQEQCINAANFADFLPKSSKQPPSDSPLLTQWLKSSPAKPQTPKKPFSLNLPKRADDWALAINDMVSAFLAEFGTIPNQTQAWVRLNEAPPKGYSIGQGVDRGEPCLTMPGVKPLSRTAFNKRWRTIPPTIAENKPE